MKIRIGGAYKIFLFSLKIYNGEIELLWRISKDKKQWLWLGYSNAKHDKRVWNKQIGKYHFCLYIRNIVEVNTTFKGKKIIGRLNLTRLFNRDYHVYSTGDCTGCNY